MSESPAEDDDGGIFCQSCSPTTRKCGYYLTFVVGIVGFGIGFVMSFFGTTWVEICASFLILFCPLWIKSPKKCFMDLKDVLKVISFLVFLAFLIVITIGTICSWDGFGMYALGVGLGLSGCWYFLTYFPNGQKAFLDCIKSCCKGGESA